MDAMTGLFLIYLATFVLCILAAIGINWAIWRGVEKVKRYFWPMQQAQADLHHTYRRGER